MTITRPRRAFSMIELLVVLAIVTILFSISLATIRRAREAANTTQCLANLRQIGLALFTYANEHKGCLVPGDYVGIIDGGSAPGAGNWADILVEGNYINAPIGAYPANKFVAEFPDGMSDVPTILRCPSGTDENAAENYPTSQADARGAGYFVRGSDMTHQAVFTWYAVNAMPRLQGQDLTADERRPRPFNVLPDFGNGYNDWGITRMAKLKPTLPLVFDGVWCFNGDILRINARHNHRTATNVLYADGHAEKQVTTSLPNTSWYLR